MSQVMNLSALIPMTFRDLERRDTKGQIFQGGSP